MSLFAQWLKQCRKELDLTQEELARRLGCAAVTLRKIEAGSRRPSKQLAELLAEHFHIPPAERAAFLKFARGASNAYLRPSSITIMRDHRAPWRMLFQNPTNLPVPLTRLIGRQKELAAVKDYFCTHDLHLVTITGPPGIGKTRFALELATQLNEDFDDGIFLVALASIGNPDLVVPTIARALGLEENDSRPIFQALIEFLHDKRMLLLLDNFEQVVGAAVQVADLLTACPTLKMLVTSREALHIRGEQQFPLSPLEFPAPTEQPLSAITQYPAVALFLERAHAVKPDLTISNHDLEDIAVICSALDGLPLAIELAAAHANLLSPREIRARMQHRLEFLTHGPRDLPARHRTLRHAIAWSHDLLDANEGTLFARLAVFAGGWTLEAAQTICGNGLEIGREMQSLLDKSLVRRDEGGMDNTRLTMLETIREYALERLRESAEESRVRDRHLDYFLALAEEGEPELHGPHQSEWLDRLERERDNLRAALDWAQQAENSTEKGLRLAGALWWFWYTRGYHTEALERYHQVLTRSEGFATPARAKALNAAGFMHAVQGNSAAARQLLDEALALASAQQDKLNSAWALHILAREALSQDDYAGARSLASKALELWRELRAAWGIADSLNSLGEMAFLQGDDEQARMWYEEAVIMFRKLQDQDLLALPLRRLGQIALHQGNHARAIAMCKESLALNVQVGNQQGISACLAALAGAAASLGQTGPPGHRSEYLHRAACLFGAAAAFLSMSRSRLGRIDRAEYEKNIEIVRHLLGEQAFAEAMADGQAMSPWQALSFALKG